MAERQEGSFWETIQKKLRDSGIDLELPDLGDLDPSNCKMVCMPMGLASTLREMGKESRGHSIMARVDDETLRSLDAWVETGAVKSRSEAAALFIREGLGVRAEELSELEGALQEVERAKEKLRRKARTVLGEESADQSEEDEDV